MFVKFSSGRWFCGLGILGSAIALEASCALAQISSDGTLPNNTTVTLNGSTFNITGGTQAGSNLFHSFKEFSVPTGGTAFFNNGIDIANIISRVTGGSISNIDGLIRSQGTANLFLLNPSGIIFGRNASLNIGGSFLATTANAIQFGDTGIFSATNPETPTQLLAIDPSALLFNQITAPIQNQSIAPAGLTPTGFESSGLRVPDGRSLLLVGGDIKMDSGRLRAYGGRVELGGLATPGTVGLAVDGNNLRLSFPENVTRSDVSLTNQASVRVDAGSGGSIAINARNIELLGGSQLTAGIGEGLGSAGAVAGDITLNATGEIKVVGSYIFNEVRSLGIGNGGNINVSTGSLSLTDGAQLSASTFGTGDAGSVLVQAKDSVSVTGNSYIFSNVGSRGIGNGGNINISTGSLSLTNGARLSASTYGQGNAGSVFVQAKDSVTVADNSYISSNVENGGVGKGGNININATTLSLKDGAQLLTLVRGVSNTGLTGGRGNAGNVNVNATGNVTIAGSKNGFSSAIFTTLETGATGNAGNITITSDSLSLTDGAGLFSSVRTRAIGNGGNIAITAASLSLTNDVGLVTNTFGSGDAGSVFLQAKDSVSVTGDSYILTNVGPFAVGKGGNININTGSLSITDGVELATSTLGSGDAGSVFLQVNGSTSISNSNIFSDVNPGAVGKGGNINVITSSLSLTNGAGLQANTGGKGDAGNLFVQAKDFVSLERNASIFSSVENGAVGNGGSININAATLSLTDGAQLATGVREASNNRPTALGNAGNVNVNVAGTLKIAGQRNGSSSGIFSYVGQGATGSKGGNIFISSGSLSLSDGATLQASTFGNGNAGNVFLETKDSVSLSNGNIFNAVRTGAVGKGGDIQLITGSLWMTNGAQLSTSTNGTGNAGNITINARDTISLDGVSSDRSFSAVRSIVDTEGVGNGGNIKLTTGSLSLTNGSQLAAGTRGKGNAGNVIINARNSVSFNVGDAFSTVERTGVGQGGDIKISAQTLSVTNGAQLQALTRGKGDAGNVIINASGKVSFNAAYAFSAVEEQNAEGKGGDIKINADSVSVTNGAQLIASTGGKGDAGNVIIGASGSVSFDSTGVASSNVNETGVGKGGNVSISADSVSVTNGAQLIASTEGKGNAGNVIIDASGKVSFDGKGAAFTRVEQNAEGKGGNVRISADSMSVTNDAQLLANTRGKGDAGNVVIDASGSVSFDASEAFSRVNETGVGQGGDIRISAQTLSVTNGAQLQALTQGKGNAGNVIIDVRGSASFNGTSRDGRIPSAAVSSVSETGVGQSGDIKISAQTLSVTNGAQLLANTRGFGDAGNVIIDARNSVSFDAGSAFSRVNSTGVGFGGDIKISAESLSVTNGAQLQAFTEGFGDAGNIEINAKNSVSIFGTDSIRGFSSALFTFTSPNSTGIGGDIIVDTPALYLSDGAVFDARTTNNRNGGNITLNVRQAEILNGGQILSTSSNSGNAGKITLNATDRVIVNGSDRTFDDRVARFGTAAPVNANSGLFVLSQGSGIAGDIEVNSPQIRLDNTGTINATSASGNGGNINLRASDLLLLRRGSQISATAGTARQGGDGGNININSKYIIAVPDEDSDITANAFQGRGGNVQINSQGIFGIESRPRQTENSDITASSELGVAGNINLITPDNSALQNSLSELPQNSIDTNALIANSCIARTGSSEGTFTITGSGGLPYSPGDPSVSLYSTGDVRQVISNTSTSWKKGDPIVEPTGIYQLADGRLVISRECL
ncbi:filamentous hemagglutinin N-terminal domain-containing protein [Scytonema sp. UIC 10036]|uniref:beta strand repeat-containing protein n=1 Tax=Scytonema sp. UIC 10036 TaxID=2304196 RepID=UPI0012DA7985|nr:filamentous hemagglutinin N-terminal domain-containing protein [Scytonema sp. UIC 10036]MUG92802.1 filamentous hemagglutinin N-terminal domain-containing protein [Scytonema sp. UIC 10036]